MAEKTVKVRLVKGLRGCQERHRVSVRALGLSPAGDPIGPTAIDIAPTTQPSLGPGFRRSCLAFPATR